MTIDLYTWATPNGRKVSVMLEEVGLPYKEHAINISKGEQFQPDFLKISPNNRIPAIVDPDGPDGKPISVFETGAIMIYLGEKTGKLIPTDPRKRIAMLEWLMWQMGGFGPMLGQAHHFLGMDEPDEYGVQRSTAGSPTTNMWRATNTRWPTLPSSAGPTATRATRST
jgi:GST-like protein